MKNYLSSLISHLSSRRGFTLIELMVVISITAVLGTLGIAGFISYNQAQVLQSSASEVATMLNLAKSRAQSQIMPSELCSGNINGYKVEISPPSKPKEYALYLRCSVSGDMKIGEQDKFLPADLSFDANYSFFFPVQEGGVETPGRIAITNSNGKTVYVMVNAFGGVSVRSSLPVPTPIPTSTPTPAPTPTPIPTATVFVSYADPSVQRPILAKSADSGDTWSYTTVGINGRNTVGLATSVDAIDSNTAFVAYTDATIVNDIYTVPPAVNIKRISNGTQDDLPRSRSMERYDAGLGSNIAAIDYNTASACEYYSSGGQLVCPGFAGTFGGLLEIIGSTTCTTTAGNNAILDIINNNTRFVSYNLTRTCNDGYPGATGGYFTSMINGTLNTIAVNGVGPVIDAVDSNTVFMIYQKYSGGVYISLSLNKSIDGGNTWSSSASITSHLSSNYYLKVVDNNTIFIEYNYYADNAWNYALAKSIDGGVTFSSVTLPVPQIGSLDAIDSNTIFIVNRLYDASQTLVLNRSIDGGTTWSNKTIATNASSGSISVIRN